MMALEPGLTLIEASAGTGKTYTLCRIVLRLIAQQGIPIDRILAVTFTQAATDELASRIRELLHHCLEQLAAERIEEPVLKEILQEEKLSPREVRKRLQRSLQLFDEAPISTIHGFCKRSLELVSLESDTAFDARLEHIENELVERLRSEYIRIHILEQSPLLSALLDELKLEKKLQLAGREFAAHPDALLEPEGSGDSPAALEASFQRFLSRLPDLLDREDLAPHIRKGSKLERLLLSEDSKNALRALVQRGRPRLSDIDLLKTFSREAWKSGIKKSGSHLSTPPAFEDASRFWEEAQAYFDGLVASYRDWLFRRLKSEKERRNIISFNDLLHLLNSALSSERGDAVARAISERYDAALIDEFQDTDPVQYRIAQRLFGDGSKYLVLIGDPKQAIYRFRGADIFTYFNATRAAGLKRERLSDNYRSSPTLVDAVNTLFLNAPDAFAFNEITFEPVKAAGPSQCEKPLCIHAIGFDEPAPSKQEQAIHAAATTAARDLAERIAAEPDLNLETVAFLVNTNGEADALAASLSRQGIDCIIKAERSVFQTPEAATLALLLECLAHPSDMRLARAFLLSPIAGYVWQDLIAPDFEAKSYELVSYLREWAKNWQSLNFDAAFHRLLSIAGTSARLLGQLDGERSYVNLCQLSELLQGEARSRKSSPTHLFAWLEGKSSENVSSQEEWQTRLRSDSGKPQIITIHKSKGLQFPIVICPFMSQLRARGKNDSALYHAPERANRLVVNLSPQPDSPELSRAAREEYAEQLRLIYVALTRAKDECHLYLAPEVQSSKSSSAPPSAISQFLLGSEQASQLKADKSLDAALLERLHSLESSSILIQIRDTLSPSDSPAPSARNAAPSLLLVQARPSQSIRIPPPERVLSFSSLSKLAHASELPFEEIPNDEPSLEIDPLLEPPPEPEPAPFQPSIFNLPKGARTGNLIHSILEEVDFQRPRQWGATVSEIFERLRFGYFDYKPVVRDQISRIIAKAYDANGESVTLSQIPSARRIAELEFAYPTSPQTLQSIIEAFQGHAPPALKRWAEGFSLEQASLRASMMRGFIDLVVDHQGKLYLFDWKTNHLGDTVESYIPEALEAAMSEHDYYLQYCLYCVAIKRYLENRFPQDDYYDRLGGVFYIFIRGIDDSSRNGVYFDRPERNLLNALDEALGR